MSSVQNGNLAGQDNWRGRHCGERTLAQATRAALDGNAAPLHLAEHALLSPGRAAGQTTNRLLYVLAL